MQAPEAPVDETWNLYRVSYTLLITARSKEEAQAKFHSYFGDDYLGGVQEEIGFETEALNAFYEPIQDDHLEAQYEDQVNGGDSDLP